jgi:hypothetical protein
MKVMAKTDRRKEPAKDNNRANPLKVKARKAARQKVGVALLVWVAREWGKNQQSA